MYHYGIHILQQGLRKPPRVAAEKAIVSGALELEDRMLVCLQLRPSLDWDGWKGRGQFRKSYC